MVFWFEINCRGHCPRLFLLADLVVHNRPEKFIIFLWPADQRRLAGFGFGYLAPQYVHANVRRPEFYWSGDQLGDAFGDFGLANGLDGYLVGYYFGIADNLGSGAGFYRMDDRRAREGAILTFGH